jgi:hypothetical protein
MDQGIKRLVQSHPADVLALAVPGAEYLETLQSEVATEPQLLLDTLLRVRFEGVVCAVDLEAEARPRPDIGRRLFEIRRPREHREGSAGHLGRPVAGAERCHPILTL